MITEDITLSLGIKGGFTYYHASVTNLDVVNPDAPAFAQNEKRFNTNIGVGAYIYSYQFYAGLSLPRMLQTSFNRKFDKTLKSPLYIIEGYNYEINSDWVLMPSVLAGAIIGLPMTCDITVQVLYKGQFYFGAHYRIGDAFGIFFVMKLKHDISVGYAFYFLLNKLSRINTGTH